MNRKDGSGGIPALITTTVDVATSTSPTKEVRVAAAAGSTAVLSSSLNPSTTVSAGTAVMPTAPGLVNTAESTNTNTPSSSRDASLRWKDIPMLAQLVEEADTAKFYAYCEEVRHSRP